jgi:hypothetical protein
MLWNGIWVHPYIVITVEGGGQNLENWGQAELRRHCFDFVEALNIPILHHTSITHIWSVWATSHAVERHLGAPLYSYDGAGGGPNFRKLVSGGAKMTSWCHCWGCKPPHSASHIHNTCIWSVWAPSYAVWVHPYTVIMVQGGGKFWKIGVRRSKNDIMVSLLRL